MVSSSASRGLWNDTLKTMQPWVKGIAASIAAVGLFAALWGLWWDAQAQGEPWVFWSGVGLLVVVTLGYPTATWIRRLRIRIRVTRTFLDKGKHFDELQATIGSLRSAAFGWQDRAERAEAKLNDWDAETLRRGRSQAIGELAGSLAMTTFGATGLVILPPDEEVAIVARITGGDPPPVGAIFFIAGAVAHDVKAVIRCDGYQDPNTVSFRVEAYRTMTHIDLLAAARSHSALPPNLMILHRQSSENFNEER